MPHSFAAYSLQSTFDELQAQIQPVLSSWKSKGMMAVKNQFDKALLLVWGWHWGELPLEFHDFTRLLVLNSVISNKNWKGIAIEVQFTRS